MILHVARMVGITTLIILCVFYPFLPGQYDALALPLSMMTQVGVAAGLLLVPIDVLWLLYELRKQSHIRKNQKVIARRNYFALVSAIAFLFISIAVTFIAFATVGFSLASISCIIWIIILFRLISTLKKMKDIESDNFSFAPIYLMFVPAVAILLQLFLGTSITNFSRDYAIANSRRYIIDIEAYHSQHGRYPASLLAMWKDYYPNVVGIEKFHYTPSQSAYNLFFEQPRLLFDNIGTREWVVYNPMDEHQMFSHTSWFLLLTPSELERSQGWYAVHDTAHPYWKSFWFD